MTRLEQGECLIIATGRLPPVHKRIMSDLLHCLYPFFIRVAFSRITFSSDTKYAKAAIQLKKIDKEILDHYFNRLTALSCLYNRQEQKWRPGLGFEGLKGRPRGTHQGKWAYCFISFKRSFTGNQDACFLSKFGLRFTSKRIYHGNRENWEVKLPKKHLPIKETTQADVCKHLDCEETCKLFKRRTFKHVSQSHEWK